MTPQQWIAFILVSGLTLGLLVAEIAHRVRRRNWARLDRNR